MQPHTATTPTFWAPLILEVGTQLEQRSISTGALAKIPHLAHIGTQHPDVLWINDTEESLSIDDVREVQHQLSYHGYGNQVRIIVLLHADTASIPAQNALLKMLEEPPQNTQLILVVAQASTMAPTVLSRCTVLTPNQAGQTTPNSSTLPELPEKFIQLLTTPELCAYHEALTLSETWSERADAVRALETALRFCQARPPTAASPHRLTLLLETTTQLKLNANLKLALGQLFFELKKVA